MEWSWFHLLPLILGLLTIVFTIRAVRSLTSILKRRDKYTRIQENQKELEGLIKQAKELAKNGDLKVELFQVKLENSLASHSEVSGLGLIDGEGGPSERNEFDRPSLSIVRQEEDPSVSGT